jgi:predicted metal-dependent HD superfamily phosphohydrolase
VLCDADLAILAADEERYASYVAGVRHEYAAVPDEAFRRGRAQVLRSLLEAPSLFATSYGRQHWEDTARANLTKELTDLES